MDGRMYVIAALVMGGAADVGGTVDKPDDAARRCIQRAQVAPPIALPGGEVYFRGQPNPKTSYFARLKGEPCAGLDRFSILTIETTAAGYCVGDKIRAYRDATKIEGPACVVDHFEPVDGRGV